MGPFTKSCFVSLVSSAYLRNCAVRRPDSSEFQLSGHRRSRLAGIDSHIQHESALLSLRRAAHALIAPQNFPQSYTIVVRHSMVFLYDPLSWRISIKDVFEIVLICFIKTYACYYLLVWPTKTACLAQYRITYLCTNTLGW